MNKIVFFSDWKKMYQHPTPKVHPFVEVPFLDKGSYDDADAFVQINMQHTHHVKEPFREPFYNYIKQSGKPSIVFETAVLRENCAEHFKDKYYRFKSKNKKINAKEVIRYCIFLSDWKPGHYFEYNDKPIQPWKKGDILVLEKDVYHRSANAGTTFKYSAQITGVLK